MAVSPQGTALLAFNWATLVKVVALGTSHCSCGALPGQDNPGDWGK